MRSETIVCASILATVLAYDCGRCAARAQPPDDRTVLIRVAVAEARWTARRDHAAIWGVLARWARRDGSTLAQVARERVWRFSRPPRWISRLEPSCSYPVGWPARLSWGRHTNLCWELYSAADAFLRGELPDVCPAARGWRADGPALLRALELGRREVCRGRGLINRYVR